MFLDLKPHEGIVSFGGSGKGKIVGISKVGKHHLPTIKNVLYVDGLKYNLLSICQFCNNGHENLYRINLHELNNKKETCLMSKDDERWIWHKKTSRIVTFRFAWTNKSKSWRILIKSILDKSIYELSKGRRPNISYFHPFGCECFLLNTRDQLGKFDSEVGKGILLRYFDTSKAYRVFNLKTLVVEEFIHNDGLTLDKRLSELEKDFAYLQIGSSDKPTDSPKPSYARIVQHKIPTNDQPHKD
ncbi:hypothetical protein CR513_25904, partial [Mucuna pruriens]